MTPEMIEILTKAAADPSGQVSIERPRQGTWPPGLHLLKQLEKSQHLVRVSTHVSSSTGAVAAVYQITDKGRRATRGRSEWR